MLTSEQSIFGRLFPWHQPRKPLGRPPKLITTRPLCEMYRSGMTLKQVAEQIGVSTSVVRRALARNGIESRRRGRPDGQKSETIKRRMAVALAGAADGRTLQDIADELGCTRQYVSHLLRKNGVKTKFSGNLGQFSAECGAHRQAEIVRRWEQGLCVESIARAVGMTQGSVFLVLRRAGVDMPARHRRPAADKHAQAISMARSGSSFDEIAEKLGWTRQSAITALHRLGYGQHLGYPVEARSAQPGSGSPISHQIPAKARGR